MHPLQIFQQVISGNFAAAVLLLKHHSKFRVDPAYRKMADILEDIQQMLESGHFTHEAFSEIQDVMSFQCVTVISSSF